MHTPRNGGLDLIRGVAAGLVLATHLWHQGDATFLGPLAQGGHVGVYIFFALSGYLLYRPFVSGPVDLGRYATSRIARLAPAYYAAALLILASGLEPGMVANPWPALLVVVNVFPEASALRVFGQAWTLGVEVAFYAALPIVALGSLRRPWLLAAFVGLSYWLSSMADSRWLLWQFPTLFWAFGAGMFVARYQDRLAPLARAWPVGVALVVVGLLKAAADIRGDVPTVLGTAWLILASAAYRPRLAWARWPADISYAVYLWHAAVIVGLAGMGLRGWPLVVAVLAVTCAIATASFVLLERPVMRWASAGVRRRDSQGARAVAGSPASP